jgi:hypothetical protein
MNHDLKMCQERRAKLPGRLDLEDLPEAVKKQDMSLEWNRSHGVWLFQSPAYQRSAWP